MDGLGVSSNFVVTLGDGNVSGTAYNLPIGISDIMMPVSKLFTWMKGHYFVVSGLAFNYLDFMFYCTVSSIFISFIWWTFWRSDKW